MYNELELKSRPTQTLCRTHKQCQSGGSASLGEELNRLKWLTLIKQQTTVSVKWNLFCSQNPSMYLYCLMLLNGLCTIQQVTFQFQTYLKTGWSCAYRRWPGL